MSQRSCNRRANDNTPIIRVTMVVRQRHDKHQPSDRSSAVLSKTANLRTTHCVSKRANTRDRDVKQADQPPLQPLPSTSCQTLSMSKLLDTTCERKFQQPVSALIAPADRYDAGSHTYPPLRMAVQGSPNMQPPSCLPQRRTPCTQGACRAYLWRPSHVPHHTRRQACWLTQRGPGGLLAASGPAGIARALRMLHTAAPACNFLPLASEAQRCQSAALP
jgi:hypothetical protein